MQRTGRTNKEVTDQSCTFERISAKKKKREAVHALRDEDRRIAKKRVPVRARLEPVEPAEYADKVFAPVSMLRFAVW
jgi:hypothetical protein